MGNLGRCSWLGYRDKAGSGWWLRAIVGERVSGSPRGTHTCVRCYVGALPMEKGDPGWGQLSPTAGPPHLPRKRASLLPVPPSQKVCSLSL